MKGNHTDHEKKRKKQEFEELNINIEKVFSCLYNDNVMNFQFNLPSNTPTQIKSSQIKHNNLLLKPFIPFHFLIFDFNSVWSCLLRFVFEYCICYCIYL